MRRFYSADLDTTPQKRVPVCWEQSAPASPLRSYFLEIISEVCPGSPEENHGCEPELVRSCFCALIDERRFRAGNGGNDHFDLSSGIGVRDAQLTAEFLGPLLDAPDADP